MGGMVFPIASGDLAARGSGRGVGEVADGGLSKIELASTLL
jgi:hypothetical protein